MIRRSFIVHSAFAAGALAFAGDAPAWAQAGNNAGVANTGDRDYTIGVSPAARCSDRAKSGDSSRDALNECEYALMNDLTVVDRAGTLVNRGIIREARGDVDGALDDYVDAIALSPNVAEAYANSGRIYATRANWPAAADALSQAIPLIQDPLLLRALYFDRAVAREELGDIAGAYADYQAAAATDPTWDAPRQELGRFRVDGEAAGGGV